MVLENIDLSLEDIIKKNKGNRSRSGPRRGRGGGGGLRRGSTARGPRRSSGPGGVMRGRKRGGVARRDVNSTWKHDMFDGAKKVSSGVTKLLVSNLDFGVSDSDIQELFSEFGPLKSAAVHYDRSGRSLGSADVIFERRADAIKAMKQYNGVPLDGREMNIQLATSEIPMASSIRKGPRLGGSFKPRSPTRSFKGRPRGGRGSGGAGGARRGANRGGGGGKRQPAKPLTAEELDAELEAYTKEVK